jgi:hypothetical protein
MVFAAPLREGFGNSGQALKSPAPRKSVKRKVLHWQETIRRLVREEINRHGAA